VLTLAQYSTTPPSADRTSVRPRVRCSYPAQSRRNIVPELNDLRCVRFGMTYTCLAVFPVPPILWLSSSASPVLRHVVLRRCKEPSIQQCIAEAQSVTFQGAVVLRRSIYKRMACGSDTSHSMLIGPLTLRRSTTAVSRRICAGPASAQRSKAGRGVCFLQVIHVATVCKPLILPCEQYNAD
jgi:hypothetical protein